MLRLVVLMPVAQVSWIGLAVQVLLIL